MSKLREAAAMLVDHGRALGALDQARVYGAQLMRAANEAAAGGETPFSKALGELAKSHFDAQAHLEGRAGEAMKLAQELLRELDHPGAVLARRLVVTWRAARAAWRAAR